MGRDKLLRTGLTAIAAAACIGVSVPASAWSLKTHLWISEKILDEVDRSGDQCRLDFSLAGNSRYALDREACNALRQHRAEFRAGVLGPDVFPDFIVGQATTHPGSNAEPHANDGTGKWTTGQYLTHLLNAARTPAELAFAYGYAVHAAGDVFAHSYVNNYAGDVFDVMQHEHRVELRHFVLEKYIEERTTLPRSLTLDTKSVRAPVALVVDKLILDESLRQPYGRAPAARHMLAMYDRLQHESKRARADKPLLDKTGQAVKVLEGELEQLRRQKELQLRALGAAERQSALKPAPAPEVLSSTSETLRAVANAPDTDEADKQTIAKLDAMLKARKASPPVLKGFAGTLQQKLLHTAAQELELAASLNEAREAHGSVELRQAMRENRIAGMRLATDAYVEASLAGALDVMNGTGTPVGSYQAWSDCWALVYAGVPHQWLEAKCKLKLSLEEIRAGLEADVQAAVQMLPPKVQKLYERYAIAKDKLRELARKEAWNIADASVAALSKDQATLRFIEAITRPEHTAQDLNSAYLEQRQDGKALILLEGAAGMIDQDLATRDGAAHPDEFQALRHSLTLAKLSLLDLDTVNQMVRDHVGIGRSTLFTDGKPLYPRGGRRTSLLPLMVKSIDGNHQWQAYGIPYPRNTLDAVTLEPSAARRFGYNAYREPGFGLRLFADPAVREKLFAKLFPTPFAGAIHNYLNERNLNPFRTCDDAAFPLTTLADGSPAIPARQCPR